MLWACGNLWLKYGMSELGGVKGLNLTECNMQRPSVLGSLRRSLYASKKALHAFYILRVHL